MKARTKDAVSMDVVKNAQAAQSLVAALATDDDDLRHDMIEGETDLFEAIEAALAEIDECDVMAEGIAAKISQFQERKSRADARAVRLRGLIEQAMAIAELSSVKLCSATLTIKAVPPKPVYVDESLIPSAYWKQPEPVLDRKKVLEDLKANVEIPGASLSNGTTSLQIRRS